MLHNAELSGLKLGADTSSCNNTIEIIKQIELKRLASFQQDNPELFLPLDIEVDGVEAFDNNNDTKMDPPPDTDNNSEMEEGEIPWMEVSHQRTKKCQARCRYFKNNSL